MVHFNHKNFLRKALPFFLLSFLILFICFFLIQSYLLHLQEALPGSLISALFFSLFMSTHFYRESTPSTLEINAHNKNPQIPLDVYYQDILQQLFLLRFKKVSENEKIEVYASSGRLGLFHHGLTIEKNPFFILVKGPKFYLKILISHLHLNKDAEKSM